MDHYLDVDLIAKFPQKNNVLLRNSIKEFYYKDKNNQRERKLKKLRKISNQDQEESSDNFLEDTSQKRLYKRFFRHIEANYEYKVCPFFEQIEKKNEESIDTISEEIKSNIDENENLEISSLKEIIKIKKLTPSNLVTKVKTCDFIKWITSIFEAINQMEINDVINVNLN